MMLIPDWGCNYCHNLIKEILEPVLSSYRPYNANSDIDDLLYGLFRHKIHHIPDIAVKIFTDLLHAAHRNGLILT